MNIIKNLFGKYSHLLQSNQKTKEEITSILKDTTGLVLLPEDIELKKNTLWVKADAAAKANIYMNKKKIIQEISLRLAGEKIIDIK